MIRRGKEQGWLRAEPSTLIQWASFFGVEFGGVEVKPAEGKGLAVVATSPATDQRILMRVPRELVLSKEAVELYAKSDILLRSILDAVGDFGRTPRGSILVFLLYQATKCCPDFSASNGGGSSNPLTQYIKFLPLELLPTFWTEEEVELFAGTSLQLAVKAKTKSLSREFDLLHSSTEHIPWCVEHWWDGLNGLVALDDWKQVDAFYRSRALEFPGIGDCMVPCIDMCNHASGPSTRALYESDSQGNAILIPRDDYVPDSADEITITYGDDKGACEMIFSYGFLEQSMTSAKTIFLDLDIPDTDPLKPAKLAIAASAPGVRLIDDEQQPENLQWISDYVWLICVNTEDGLGIELAHTNEGHSEIQATWRNSELRRMSMIEESLRTDPLWNVYQLRAIVMLQSRVERQLKAIYDDEDDFEQRYSEGDVRELPKSLALHLRQLETDLLEKFYEHFESEKLQLVQSTEVCEYLAKAAGTNEAEEAEDFS